jgi:hypothetical protein
MRRPARMNATGRRAKMGARGAARGPVTTAVFKTVCGAVILSWVGSTPMSLRQCFWRQALFTCPRTRTFTD